MKIDETWYVYIQKRWSAWNPFINFEFLIQKCYCRLYSQRNYSFLVNVSWIIYSKIMCTHGQWNFVSKKLQMYKIGLYGSQYVNFVILPYVEYSYTVSKFTQLLNQQQGGSFCSKQLEKVLVSFVCCRAGSR